MDRLLAPLWARAARLSPRSRILLLTVAGITLGVLLLATGVAALQLLGALGVTGGLLAARFGARLPEAWWGDPRRHLARGWPAARQRIPRRAWPAAVLGLVGVAAAVLVGRLLTAGELGWWTLGDFAKGAIALAMMATLALWGAGRSEAEREGRPDEATG